MLGETQWAWFEQELRKGDSQITIIASSIQVSCFSFANRSLNLKQVNSSYRLLQSLLIFSVFSLVSRPEYGV